MIEDKCNEVETPLTKEEAALDLKGMSELNLGDHENYKTKIVQNRWSQHRNKWLTTTSPEDPKNVKMGVESKAFPKEDESKTQQALRKKTKRTMKSTTAPYEPFQNFYPLEEVIDTYIEIWYKDDSDESSV